MDEVLDLDEFMDRAPDEELMNEVIATFLDDAQKRIEALDNAVEAQDTSQIQEIAHKIKGSAAMIAAIPLAKIAYKLEMMGKNGELEQAEENFEELIAEFQRLKNLISKPDWISLLKTTT